MSHAGYDIKTVAIKNSIREVGEYENSVKITAITLSGNRVFSYKIDGGLPTSIVKKISSCIENKAKKLDFQVLQIF